MSKRYFGKICPHCKTQFVESDTVVFCSICDTPHHLSCWQDNKGCTTFGCTGAIKEIVGNNSGSVTTSIPGQSMSSQSTQGASIESLQIEQLEKPIEAFCESKEMVFVADLPIVLENTALIIDLTNDKLFARCTFRSLTDKGIKAVLIELSCQDVWENQLGESISFEYLDLKTGRETKFGNTNLIELTDKNIRKFSVSVKKILFDDDTVVTGGNNLFTMPAPVLLSQYLKSNELASEYARETTPKAQFVPECTDSIWRCTCGALNMANENVCHSCESSKENLIAALNTEMLNFNMLKFQEEKRVAEEKAMAEQAERIRFAKEQMRLEQERKEQERIEAERVKKKKKLRRIKIIVAIISSILAILLICGIVLCSILYRRYQSACSALEDGNYDTAYQMFVDLDGFMDSETMEREAMYQKGKATLENNQFDEAIIIFMELGDYSDSKALLADAKNKKENAQNEARYQAGLNTLNNKQYGIAIAVFYSLGDFADSKDKLAEAQYLMACDYLEKKAYVQAVAIFEDIGHYKDSADKIKEAKYSYVLANRNNEDETTYEYLKALMSTGYRDTSTIFNNLYAWKVTVLGWNSSEYSSSYTSSINKYRPVYCHILLKGGTPGASTILSVSGTDPGGSDIHYTFEYAHYDDWTGWFGWPSGLYDYPETGDTGSIQICFYDDAGNKIGNSAVKITE